MLIETDLDWVRGYRGSVDDPKDFDEFWRATLDAEHDTPLDVRLEAVETDLALVDVYDVTFRGAGGTDVRAWLRLPAGATGPLPAVVTYVGYGGGRGRPEETLIWVAAGFAHLHMDTRGQGAVWSLGDTEDSAVGAPQIPGVMTKGIRSREEYYYRRLFVDAVRAVDVAKGLSQVDPARVAVAGGSQGGGITLAVAGLRDDLAAAVAFVPFLCDIPRGITTTDSYPYREVTDYLRVHRADTEQVLTVLSYFDGVNFARRATAPAYISVGLMDDVFPPSTVYAASNNYAGPHEITEWAYNAHEGGAIDDERAALAFLRRQLGTP
jgi:cephalosporin-C deacetylase